MNEVTLKHPCRSIFHDVVLVLLLTHGRHFIKSQPGGVDARSNGIVNHSHGGDLLLSTLEEEVFDSGTVEILRSSKGKAGLGCPTVQFCANS